MKKWILNLGLTTLTILPIVAVASCSSTTINESPKLTTEVTKYKTPFTIKDSSKTITPTAAVETINTGSNAQKLAALQTLVALKLDITNFTYEVTKATVGTDNRVDVSIKIAEKLDPTKNQIINLIINGFTKPTDSPLDTEVKRFQVSVAATEAGTKLKATEVITKINAAAEDQKVVELEKLAEVPKVNQGFEIKVLEIKATEEETSLEVLLEVLETATPTNKDNATLTITGFATLSAGEILAAQAERLVTKPVLEAKQGETPLEASTKITAQTLNDYYEAITLADGITYEFVSAKPNTSVKTTLDVTLAVKSKVAGLEDVTKIVEITGFTSPQLALDKQAELIVDQTVIEAKKGETAKAAAALMTDTTKLKTYYDAIALTEGFDYALKTDGVVVAGDTVKVTVMVTGPDTENTTAVEKTFTITGFKKEVVVEAEKLTTAVAKNQDGTTRRIIAGINDAVSQEAKLTALQAIVDLPTLTQGFKIEVGEATINPETDTSVNVVLKVVQEGTENTANATFTITGLTAETVQAEIQRLIESNLTNKTVLEAKVGETAATAGETITDLTTLAPYYDLITLPKALKYNFVSKVVDGDTVKVKVSISLQDNTEAREKEFVISGFKTRAFVALEKEAEKLTNKTVRAANNSKTAAQAQAAIRNDITLNQYYENTRLTSGFSYYFGGKSVVNKEDAKILDITLRITHQGETLYKVVQVSGFADPTAIETESQKFAISLAAKDPATLTTAAIVAIHNTATTHEAKITALKGLVTGFPEVTSAYSLTIGRPVVDPTTPTSINVPITVRPAAEVGRNAGAAEAPVTVIFTITGLTIPTDEQQLEIVKAILNNRVVISGKENEAALTAKNTIRADRQLNQYYQNTPLPAGFSYTYGGSSVVNTEKSGTLNVTLRLTFKGKVETIIVEISGFTVPAVTPESV